MDSEFQNYVKIVLSTKYIKLNNVFLPVQYLSKVYIRKASSHQKNDKCILKSSYNTDFYVLKKTFLYILITFSRHSLDKVCCVGENVENLFFNKHQVYSSSIKDERSKSRIIKIKKKFFFFVSMLNNSVKKRTIIKKYKNQRYKLTLLKVTALVCDFQFTT